MQNTIYHWIPVSVLAEITKQSPGKLQKLYREIIQGDCVPLNDVPKNIQDIYVSEYLLRDRLIDFSFLDAIRDYSAKPLCSSDVQSLFREMEMMRKESFKTTPTIVLYSMKRNILPTETVQKLMCFDRYSMKRMYPSSSVVLMF